MLKKLTEKQQEALLENAMEEFGDKGLQAATVASIAKRSHVSVGVIYKYYTDKNALFAACLRRSMAMLSGTLKEASETNGSLMETAEALIRASQRFAAGHPACFRMYHAITTRPDSDGAEQYAREIETISAELYQHLISKAKSEDRIRKDADPQMFAFFFDNLLMMLHFSYGCDYYRHRMEIFCGGKAKDPAFDERMVRTLLSFIGAAFGVKEG